MPRPGGIIDANRRLGRSIVAIRSDAAGVEKSYLRDMLAAGERILEVGCGAGRLMPHYADRARRCVGIDLPAALARPERGNPPGNADLVAGSGPRLPFRDASFDAVIFGSSL